MTFASLNICAYFQYEQKHKFISKFSNIWKFKRHKRFSMFCVWMTLDDIVVMWYTFRLAFRPDEAIENDILYVLFWRSVFLISFCTWRWNINTLVAFKFQISDLASWRLSCFRYLDIINDRLLLSVERNTREKHSFWS